MSDRFMMNRSTLEAVALFRGLWMMQAEDAEDGQQEWKEAEE
jgi:hypothetical protein